MNRHIYILGVWHVELKKAININISVMKLLFLVTDVFGEPHKRVFDFLLVVNSNLYRISHLFGDTAAYWSNIANSYPPHPHSTSSFGVTPFEFWDDRDIPRN